MSFKRILIVCKKELLAAMLNPASFFAGIIFFLCSAIPFFFLSFFFVAGRGSADLRPFFTLFPFFCALVVPIFTSASVPTDYHTSLPFTALETTCGTWLSSFICLCIILYTTLLIPVVTSFFADIDIVQISTSYTVLTFYCAAAAAVGIFFSYAVKNYLVSYILTALFLLISAAIHLIPPQILPQKIIPFINYCSFAWHFDAASKGIFDTRDFVFFVTCTALCLTIATKCRKSSNYSHHVQKTIQIELKNKHVKINYILLIVFFVLVLLNSQRYYLRFDFSRGKLFSLSPYTEALLKKNPDRLNITYYLSEQLKNIYPQTRDINDFLRSYALTSSTVTYALIDPQTASLEKTLESIGVLPQQIQTNEQNQIGFLTVYSAIVLEYGGKTAQIPFIISTAGLEYDIHIRVQFLTENISRSAAILFGETGSFEETYSYVIPWLNAAGFTCVQIAAQDLNHLEAHIPLIVIGSEALSEDAVFTIESFVLRGGSAVFAVSSHTVAVHQNWTVSPVQNHLLLNLLDFWGISVGKNIVLDSQNYRITMQSTQDTLFQYVDYPFWIRVLPRFAEHNGALSASFLGMQAYWPNPLFVSAEKNARPLLKTSPQAWLLDATDETTDFTTDPFTAQKPNEKTRGQYTLAAVSDGPFLPYSDTANNLISLRKNRLAVIGNQYFCSNMVEYTNSPQNIDFLANVLLWLSAEDDVLALKTKGGDLFSFTKITEASELAAAKKIVSVVLCSVPVGALLFYAFFMLKRRRAK